MDNLWILVGGIPTPLKNMSQLGWWHYQYMEKEKMFQSPPTSYSLLDPSWPSVRTSTAVGPTGFQAAHQLSRKHVITIKLAGTNGSSPQPSNTIGSTVKFPEQDGPNLRWSSSSNISSQAGNQPTQSKWCPLPSEIHMSHLMSLRII